MLAMLAYKGGTACMGTLAWVTVHVDMHMCVPGHAWSSLPYPGPCNSCCSPMAQGLKLAVLDWEAGPFQVGTLTPSPPWQVLKRAGKTVAVCGAVSSPRPGNRL